MKVVRIRDRRRSHTGRRRAWMYVMHETPRVSLSRARSFALRMEGAAADALAARLAFLSPGHEVEAVAVPPA